jgi:hypothetical protein
MAATINTILLQVNSLGEKYDETTAAGNITPGHLITVGSTNTAVVHATADAATPVYIAIEERLKGLMVDDVYASGAKVLYQKLQPTDQFWGLLHQGYNVVPGTILSSNGTGAFKKSSSSTSVGLVKALETVSNSGGSAPVRCKMEVIFGGQTGVGLLTTTSTTTTTTTTGA